MRKVTLQARDAFFSRKNFRKWNTEVVDTESETRLLLHGNLIAVYVRETSELRFTMAGWPTVVTRERLNGILWRQIRQKDGVQFYGKTRIEEDKWYSLNDLE